LSAARRISPRLRCGPSPAFGQSVAGGRYTVGMAGNVVHQLLATDMALDKLGARAISAEAVSPKAFMIQRQPRRANLGRRRPTRRGSIPRRSSWPFARGVRARRAPMMSARPGCSPDREPGRYGRERHGAPAAALGKQAFGQPQLRRSRLVPWVRPQPLGGDDRIRAKGAADPDVRHRRRLDPVRRHLFDHAAPGAATSQPSSLPQVWIRVKVVPHLAGSANSASASRRSEASSSSLNVSSRRDSSATLN
jgi:hypothetical protein